MKAQLLLLLLTAFVAQYATASDCDAPGRKNLVGTVTSTAIKDRAGNTVRYFIDHYGQDCRLSKREILDAKSQIMAYELFFYDDSSKVPQSERPKRWNETYSADGSLLFRNTLDGQMLDSSGKVIPECEMWKFAQYLPPEWQPAKTICDGAS